MAKLLKSPAIMASRISTVFLPEISNELCDRINFLLREKQAGNNFDLNIEGIVAVVHKLLEQ